MIKTPFRPSKINASDKLHKLICTRFKHNTADEVYVPVDARQSIDPKRFGRPSMHSCVWIVKEDVEKPLFNAWFKDDVVNITVKVPGDTDVRLNVRNIVCLLFIDFVPIVNRFPLCENLFLIFVDMLMAHHISVNTSIVSRWCIGHEWFCTGKCLLSICLSIEFTLYSINLYVRVVLCSFICVKCVVWCEGACGLTLETQFFFSFILYVMSV